MYVIRGDKTENVCCHGDDLLTPRTTQNTCIVAVINGTINGDCELLSGFKMAAHSIHASLVSLQSFENLSSSCAR